ncbi:MAG: hypothetical protein IIB53_06665 [Planctomycetes bacterium]|nr:hypothetical protein [Planctomycetota bacterium]MCH8260375.1 hypothetical protein [Planctomycetota bacterium]
MLPNEWGGLRERWADATLRPKDMALEELFPPDIFMRAMLALSGFMADTNPK